MKKIICTGVVLLGLLFALLSMNAYALEKGIYITQSNFEDNKFLDYLIQRARRVGINTFVVDLDIPSKHYQENVYYLRKNGIGYVARIVVFPDGGTPEQVMSVNHWEKKYKLVQAAIAYGAHQIQLDYIRYNTKQPASPEHAQNILKVLQWYKERLAQQRIPLQVDVFGIASFGEEAHIGHNIKLFGQTADVICPMVYPSHFEPFKQHAVTPYETVFDSIKSIKAQFANGQLPFKLYPYIELSNYRYPLSQEKKLNYIYDQIKAVEAAGADGWYAWSPHNWYDNLFTVLETRQIR